MEKNKISKPEIPDKKIEQDILKMSIFVLDNDLYNVMLIEELLREGNFSNIKTFLTAQDLLKTMENEIPDLVLSDIMMPDMNGYELCKLIKKSPIWKHIPVIMITAASKFSDEPLKMSFDNGAMDFIGKPINEIELIARVKSALRIERQRKELLAALTEVQTLKGLLPICSYCKKIRKDQGYWEEIEHYISEHSEAVFSHGICPDCYETHIKPELEELRMGNLDSDTD